MKNKIFQILIIPNGEEWHYLPEKKPLREITSKNHGDFYCLNCLHSFATESKRKFHKKVCQNEDFCNVVRPSEDTKILEFNQISKI